MKNKITGIELFVIGTLIICATATAIIAAWTVKGCKRIRDNGLRNVAAGVWNGEE